MPRTLPDAARNHRPTVLLRSGWQTVNIGDIAHSPGVLALLEKHLPHARVIYWANAADRGVKEMLQRRFPAVALVRGDLTPQGASTPELAQAIEQADLLLHGSGPSLVAWKHVAAWTQFTSKPWGALGITVESPDETIQQIVRTAAFLFTRETESLQHLDRAGARPEHAAFAPDGVFALDLLDEQRNAAFMAEHGLAEGQFAVFVPRLRRTPYHLIHPDQPHAPARVAEITELNARWAEPDHAKMRAAITRYVRETGRAAVLVPEMTYELDIMDVLLIRPLPEDVRAKVVRRRDYWLPDEAASLYRRAQSVVSFECHSPIIALARGTSAIYLRQPQDTIKGRMYYDLGLGDWVHEIEQSQGPQIADTLMRQVSDPAAARRRVEATMRQAHALYEQAFAVIQATLEGAVRPSA